MHPRMAQPLRLAIPGRTNLDWILERRPSTLQSAWSAGASDPTGPEFWLLGLAFLAAYLLLNMLTARYQFQSLGITLWSPDDGLAILLLMQSAQYAPFVLVGAILADIFISHVQHSLYVVVIAETLLTIGYAVFALGLRDAIRFDPRRTDLANVLSMLAAVPAGSIVTSAIYCCVLYFAGALPAGQFVSALRQFWIGDAVGIIVVISAATAVYSLISEPRRFLRRREAINWGVFVAGACLAFALLLSEGGARALQFFYFLFLPIIWIGMRQGYIGAALGLFAMQTAFFLTASSIGLDAHDFDQFQILMLVLSITALLLGAVVTERERARLMLREQQAELVRVSAHATAGAMGMLLAHELSQPLSTVGAYMLAARRMVQSGRAPSG